MGAITERQNSIRRLRNNVTHIQLSFDYDPNCKMLTEACMEKAPHFMQRLFSNLLNKKDFKEFLKTKDDISNALKTTKLILGIIRQYRGMKHSFPRCEYCRRRICDCSDRYLVNEEMNREIVSRKNAITPV